MDTLETLRATLLAQMTYPPDPAILDAFVAEFTQTVDDEMANWTHLTEEELVNGWRAWMEDLVRSIRFESDEDRNAFRVRLEPVFQKAQTAIHQVRGASAVIE